MSIAVIVRFIPAILSKAKPLLRFLKSGSSITPAQKEMMVLANKIYKNEICEMSKRLGIKEEVLRSFLPRIKLIDTSGRIGGGAGFKLYGSTRFLIDLKTVEYFLNTGMPRVNLTGNVLMLKPSNINSVIHNFVSHETRHIEQIMSPLVHLSRKEYIDLTAKTFLNLIKKLSLDKAPGKIADLLLKIYANIHGTLRFNFHSGLKKIKSVPTTQEHAQKARSLMEDYANSQLASVKAQSSFEISDLKNYFNDKCEVDARMYSLFSRLRSLFRKIDSSSVLTKEEVHKLSKELNFLKRERRSESSGFLFPQDKQLKTQLAEIRTVMFLLRALISNKRMPSHELREGLRCLF
ncbi:MAG: hypothetical protein HYY52_03210 [Candidatus Melainabacteria bacterium]|nr:hypothetical protein [Candidatus Melainabacteria bacterium]